MLLRGVGEVMKLYELATVSMAYVILLRWLKGSRSNAISPDLEDLLSSSVALQHLFAQSWSLCNIPENMDDWRSLSHYCPLTLEASKENTFRDILFSSSLGTDGCTYQS
jgi:hypothetical protein